MTGADLAQALDLKRSGRGWRGPCPLHGGNSFTVDEKHGRVLVKCWSGCAQEAVLGELRGRGLWPERQRVDFTAEEKRRYAKAVAQAEVMARLAGAWWCEKLIELEELKAGAVDAGGGAWNTILLSAAAREQARLSRLDARGVIEAWKEARCLYPDETARLERAGGAWRQACERMCRLLAGYFTRRGLPEYAQR